LKKVLFISYDGMTDPLGQSQVIPYLAGLTQYGYSFTILSCDKPEKYKANKDYVQKLMEPHGIQWVSIPYHKSPPVLSSVYDFFKLRNMAMRLHKKEKFDMVHTRVGLPTLVAQWMKRKTGIKFLNDIRGFWADERVDGGMWNLKNPVYKTIYRFFKKHEQECVLEADYNTVLTYAARKEMHTWDFIPNQPLPIEVIPCSADLELFNPDKVDPTLRNSLQQELNINDGDCIISYLGSIGGWYLTEEMMRFCKMLGDAMPEAKFLFISPHRHDEITAAAAKYGVPPQKIITRQGKRHEVPALLSFSSYSLFFIKPCYSKISSSPTKHGEIMAMGIPVITNGGVGDVAEIVTNYKAGFVVTDFTDAAFAKVVDQIKAQPPFDKKAIRAGATEFYALGNAIASYRKVYGAIFGEQS
jgi:glycosyltransferase involved in cell wall biosynthesis